MMDILLLPKHPQANLWRQVDRLLAAWRAADELGFGCEKVDFTLTFADGQTYTGTYELLSDQVRYPAPPSLAAHVGEYLTFYAGRRRPAHLSEKDCRRLTDSIRRRSPELAQTCAHWLDHYAIPYEIPADERLESSPCASRCA